MVPGEVDEEDAVPPGVRIRELRMSAARWHERMGLDLDPGWERLLIYVLAAALVCASQILKAP